MPHITHLNVRITIHVVLSFRFLSLAMEQGDKILKSIERLQLYMMIDAKIFAEACRRLISQFFLKTLLFLDRKQESVCTFVESLLLLFPEDLADVRCPLFISRLSYAIEYHHSG